MCNVKDFDFEDAQIKHRDGYTLYIRTLDLNKDFEAIKNKVNSFIMKRYEEKI